VELNRGLRAAKTTPYRQRPALPSEIASARAQDALVSPPFPDALQPGSALIAIMQVHLLKSKIHQARVTGANLNYEGSLTIAADLLELAGMLPYERILCGNMANGERFETYAIRGERGSGSIVLNGATAHLGKPGDRLTIMSFAALDAVEAQSWTPKVVVLEEGNVVASRH